MENWRSNSEDSSTTSDNFTSSISQLPQIYPPTSSPQIHHSIPNQFSSQSLQVPQLSDHPFHINDYNHHQNQRPITQSMNLEETMASIAAGQNLLVESMTRLMTRLENVSPAQQALNDLTTGMGNINLDRNAPPHQSYDPQAQRRDQPRQRGQGERPSYAPTSSMNFRMDSPSEGAYARDPTRADGISKEPRFWDNVKFSGESKLLRQFLLEIYDTLEQYANCFASDKRKINWIAAHFATSTNDVSPAQSWFLSLLMKNAHVHGVTDPYANLKSLEYVIPPLLSTDAFIQELIYVFGDKMSSKTARVLFRNVDKGIRQLSTIMRDSPLWHSMLSNPKRMQF